MKEQLNKVKGIPCDVWVYDIEVFKQYWCITFLNIKTAELVVIDNDYKALQQVMKYKIKGILGGFNNVRYDDYILKALLQGLNPYNLSQWIVKEKKAPWEYKGMRPSKLPVATFDVSDLISPTRMSLKKYEAFLGVSIEESDVPFDYDKELTQQQKDSILKYNAYDVKITALLLVKFIDQLIIKMNLISDYKLPTQFLARTNTRITAKIFEADKSLLPRYKTYKYEAPQNIKQLYKMYAPQYFWIIEKFESVEYKTKYSASYEEKQIEFGIKFQNMDLKFASGGLHGAVENYISTKDENIITIDITSNYGALIAKYNFGSRATRDMSKKMQELFNQRVKIKHVDKIKAAYLKDLIVRPFGAMDDINNDLWDPRQRQAICITGQLIIFLLSVMLSPYCEFLQVNTDGIYFKTSKENETKIKQLCDLWEKNTLMSLEWEWNKRIIQKDVNNYILIKQDDSLKTKGAQVKYYAAQFDNDTYHTVRGAVNNNLTIIDKCVVNYFVKNIPVMETLKQEKELVRFQFVYSLNGNYTDSFYGDKLLKPRKVWRIFYTLDGEPVFKAYKVNGEWKKDKVPQSSERNTIITSDIRKLTPQDIKLDYNYYEEIATNRINLYKYGENKKENITRMYPGESFECFLCGNSLMNETVVRYILDNEVCRECYIKKA
ncbi:hypothetical protein [Mycoplasma seminis]|uniref:DNA-directed DNA polymerase n=1 Tax=Mycoplasma seminis TaxID=512749 RepID=A0ABY9HAQ4_9MOLU|nr:hypothetical protein [Mycoplasma seminis]WLP85274.1 hypothetical protein Q8852_03045 [Mycoplasma seminis]